VFKDLEATLMAGEADDEMSDAAEKVKDQIKSVVDDFFKCDM